MLDGLGQQTGQLFLVEIEPGAGQIRLDPGAIDVALGDRVDVLVGQRCRHDAVDEDDPTRRSLESNSSTASMVS